MAAVSKASSMLKVNQLSKDFNIKSKEMAEVMTAEGIEYKAQKTLTPTELSILLNRLTESKQIKNIGDYLDGITCIPTKTKPEEKAAEVAAKEEAPAKETPSKAEKPKTEATAKAEPATAKAVPAATEQKPVAEQKPATEQKPAAEQKPRTRPPVYRADGGGGRWGSIRRPDRAADRKRNIPPREGRK